MEKKEKSTQSSRTEASQLDAVKSHTQDKIKISILSRKIALPTKASSNKS